MAPAIAASATDGQFDLTKFGKEGIELVTPLWLLKYLPNMLACHISIIHDIQGPSNSITCAEASGLLAVSEAMQILERGDSDVALAGGAEAKVNPLILMRQCLLKRTNDTQNEAPDQACRPFDTQAAGTVFGEAGAMVILETLEQRMQRYLGALGTLLTPVLRWEVAWLRGLSAEDSRPVDLIGRLTGALLLAHGSEDASTRLSHAEALFEAAGGVKELWVVEGADHEDLRRFDAPAYDRKVLAFLREHLHDPK